MHKTLYIIFRWQVPLLAHTCGCPCLDNFMQRYHCSDVPTNLEAAIQQQPPGYYTVDRNMIKTASIHFTEASSTNKIFYCETFPSFLRSVYFANPYLSANLHHTIFVLLIPKNNIIPNCLGFYAHYQEYFFNYAINTISI